MIEKKDIIYWIIILITNGINFVITFYLARKSLANQKRSTIAAEKQAETAQEQLELMKKEIEKKNKPWLQVERGIQFSPEGTEFNLIITNRGERLVTLERIKPSSVTYYKNPELRENPEKKVFSEAIINKVLSPGDEEKISCRLERVTHFDNVDFTIRIIDADGNPGYVKYRQDNINSPQIPPLKLIDKQIE